MRHARTRGEQSDAVPALALGVGADGPQEVDLAEVGVKRRYKVKLDKAAPSADAASAASP